MKSAARKTSKIEDTPSLQRNKFGLTEKQEAFCQGLVQHGNAKKAYLEAGYVDPGNYITAKVKELKENEAVKNRLTQLLNRQSARHGLSKDTYLEMLLENHRKAMEAGDFKAGNDALQLIGKAQGYLIDQRQTLNVTANMNKPIAVEDRTARINRLARLAGVPLTLPAPETVEAEIVDDADEE